VGAARASSDATNEQAVAQLGQMSVCLPGDPSPRGCAEPAKAGGLPERAGSGWRQFERSVSGSLGHPQVSLPCQ